MGIHLGSSKFLFLFALAAAMVLSSCAVQEGSFVEQKSNLSQGQDYQVTCAASPELKDKEIKRVAMFFTGADSLSARVMEDGLSIELLNSGFKVVERQRLEKTTFHRI